MVCMHCGKPPKDCECIDQLRLGEGPAANLAFLNLMATLDVVTLDGGVTICLNRRSFGCEHLQDDGRLVVTIELSELESRTPTARASA